MEVRKYSEVRKYGEARVPGRGLSTDLCIPKWVFIWRAMGSHWAG